MCLHRAFKTKPPKGVVTAYKVFSIEAVYTRRKGLFSGYRLEFPYYTIATKLVIGKWIKADTSESILPLYTYNSYQSGFHASVKKSAKFLSYRRMYHKGIIVPVRLRNVTTVGEQDGRCYVAEEMYVSLAEVKKAVKKAGYEGKVLITVDNKRKRV